MQHILISTALVLILVCTDLVPMLRRKDKKALWFAVPAYIFAQVINILVGLDINVPSPNQFIIIAVQSMFHIK